MAFSAPAVSEMLKKMVAEELISKDTKAGYLLSQNALEMVSSLYRKHRLIEVFLVEQLGYSPEEVHEEAEILEHTVSDHFINRLDLLLEQPQTCPHGGSIPQAGQPLIELYQTRLSQLTETGYYQLVRIHDFYQLLQQNNDLAVGDQLVVTDFDSFAQNDYYSVQVQRTRSTHHYCSTIIHRKNQSPKLNRAIGFWCLLY